MKPVISIRRPPPVDIPMLILKLRELGQTYDSIGRALGVSKNLVKHWYLGHSQPSFEDGRALITLLQVVESAEQIH